MERSSRPRRRLEFKRSPLVGPRQRKINETLGVAETLLVCLQLVQRGGNMTAQQAGLLTLGYAIAIIAFIRVGEKLLQHFGARAEIWGCLITGLSILLLMTSGRNRWRAKRDRHAQSERSRGQPPPRCDKAAATPF